MIKRCRVALVRICIVLSVVLSSACESLFPLEAGEELPDFYRQSPATGAPVPDLTVYELQGEPVNIASLIGERPLVVQLGSYSCPVFRYRRFYLRPLREAYAGRVDFVVLYTLEAHPVGAISPYADREWVPRSNRFFGIRGDQPITLDARLERARWARERMQSNARFLVDGMENQAWQALGAAPAAAFVIDREGRVVLRQPWVDPAGIAATLDELLADEPEDRRAR